MELSGIIKSLGPEIQVSPTFKKRELVITTDEQYPQHILIEFLQDKCDLLQSSRVGNSVVVGINIAGREWTNPNGEVKYFNSIKGWKISTNTNNPNPNDVPKPQSATEAYFAKNESAKEEEHDDLPF